MALNELDVSWLRQNVTLVEQQSTLFQDSIRNNIMLGDLSGTISVDDIRDAVSFAMLELVVEDLPEGLDTDIGLKGSSLSGGQRQRVALARARIRNTPVLILDESTSALDYATRAMILSAIRQWRNGKTTIIITHDVSQIQSDDFLYLLDKAQVIQEGYRKDLENHPGVFQTFLETHKAEKDDVQSHCSTEEDLDDDQTDELMSLYRDSWTPPASSRRPLSAILFGQSSLSNLQAEIVSDQHDTLIARTSKGITRVTDAEDTLQQQEEYTYQSEHGFPKPPPEALSPVSDVFRASQFNTARTSRTLLNDRISHPDMMKEKNYGIRPISQASSRSISSHSAYPKRLSIATERTSYLPKRVKNSRRTNIRSRMNREKIVDELKLPADSLPTRQILETMWPFLDWRPRLALFGALSATLVHAVATPVFAWVFSQLLATYYSIEDTKAEAIRYAMIILGIAIIDGFAEYFMFYLFECVAQAWAQALKINAMSRILAQPREFFDKPENNITHLAETLDHFAEEARNLPGRFAGIFLSMFLVLVLSVIWALTISWKITLVALASGPILFTITQAYNMISSHWEHLANKAADGVGQVLHETFVNIRTVRCLTLEEHFDTKYKAATSHAVNIGVKRAIYSGSIFGLLNTAPQFVTVALFWFGAWLISHKEHSVLNVTETFLILMLSINDITQMSQYMTQVNISREAATRLLRIAHLPESSHEDRGSLKIDSAGEISFKNVSFSYPTRRDHQVLHGLSFTIPHGSCTAIVGPSGSGKSTIASLLLKLYPTNHSLTSFLAPEAKGISISGQSLSNLHTASLRSHIAIVSQTPILIPGTIAQNITYALSPSSPESGMESIRAAAAAADINDFIDTLPNGYHTLVGDGGTALSGGQAQRIAIARALVRNPDVLILDEATSALDPVAANTIRDTVLRLVSTVPEQDDTTIPPLSPGSRAGGFWSDKEWERETGGGIVGTPGWIRARGRGAKGKEKRKQMTVIIITHAREMMSIAEHIIMVDKGRVVEEGGYAELKRKRGGAFAKLLRGETEW